MEKLTITDRLGTYSTTDLNGQLHSTQDNPSHIDAKGTMSWHKRGNLHRETGPAIKGERLEAWYREGKLHRDGDEPAIYEDKGRRVMYYKEDRLHRVFGPAVITIEGPHVEEQFWINGQKFGDRDVWEPHAAPLRAVETKSEPDTPVETAIEEILKKPRKKKDPVEVVISANETVIIPAELPLNEEKPFAHLQGIADALAKLDPEDSGPDVNGYTGDAPAPVPPLVGSEFNTHVENKGNPPPIAPEEVAPEKKERKKRQKKEPTK